VRHVIRVPAIVCTLIAANFASQPVFAAPQQTMSASENANTNNTNNEFYLTDSDQRPAEGDLVTYVQPEKPAPAIAGSDAKDSKKKAEELKKKVAGAYKDPFYLNDFSYLSNPNYQGYNLGEGLKQIPLGSGKLDVGGQYRLRYHHEHNMRGAGLTGRDDDFLLDRTRIYLDYKVTNNIRLFAEGLDAGSSHENFAPRQIEVNQLDAQNLFADSVLLDSASGKLTARGGRQELLFGSQRLLSPLDWANTRRRFEGGRLTWSNTDRATDFILVRPMNVDFHKFDSPNQNQVLYGVYNSDKTFANGPIDTYYLGFEDDTTFTRVHTLGTLIKGEADGFVWDNEFGYQFGRNPDSSDISAFSLTFGGGRKLRGDSKPTLWFFYDWASGDDSVNNGWNQLFPLGHKYLGFMDFFARRNIHDFNSMLTFSPTEKFSVLTWYHYFALSNGNQGPYNVGGGPFNPGGTVGSKDLGQEIDLLGTYKINSRSDLVLGYSHFFAGKYYSTSTNAVGDPLFNGDADFFYTQWHYNF
jgi:Alginate export